MSVQAIKTKVCIIGAGVAGLIIANILNKYGIDCIVIEQNCQRDIYARFSAGLIDSKSLSILQAYGLSDRLLKVGISHGKCEFRTPRASFIFDYASMTGGQTHYVYSQRELTADLVDKFQEFGGQILFATEAITIKNERYGAKVFCQQSEQDLIIHADFIAGCDGLDSLARAFIPEAITQPQTIDYDYAWLDITVQAALDQSDRLVYAIHPRGFAGQMLRTPAISRYYLQIPLNDTAADWSSDRIWAELRLRFATKTVPKNWIFKQGRIIKQQLLTMSGFATRTMQYKSIFLAGDAAHMLAPAGEKNINLAIQDAEVLGKAFTRFYRYHDNLSLINYSAARLPKILQAQEFSESLLHMINTQGTEPTESNNFLRLVQKFKLSQLINSEGYAQEFAHKYLSYTPPQQIAIAS